MPFDNTYLNDVLLCIRRDDQGRVSVGLALSGLFCPVDMYPRFRWSAKNPIWFSLKSLCIYIYRRCRRLFDPEYDMNPCWIAARDSGMIKVLQSWHNPGRVDMIGRVIVKGRVGRPMLQVMRMEETE